MDQRPTSLSYEFPNGRTLNIQLDPRHLFCGEMYWRARRLHEAYEQDILFIPSRVNGSVNDYLAEKYDPVRCAIADAERRELEHTVLGYVGRMLDEVDFDVSRAQLLEFCNNKIDEENKALASSDLDPMIGLILGSPHRVSHMTKLLIQFSIEFLSEGSPMALYAPGAFGPLQSSLFRILLDEMGEGKHEHKHSRLFEGTMSSIGLSPEHNYYADYFDVSTYLVTDYTYSICRNKRHFLKYLGAFFKNEACFINWQKQLGMAASEIYGPSVDRRYFDVHAHVDQSHGRWVVETLIEPAIEMYGDSIIPEILRGFYELSVYQDLFDIEFRHHVASYEAFTATDPSRLCHGTSPVEAVGPGTRSRILYDFDTMLIVRSGTAEITTTHHDARTVLASPSEALQLPRGCPVWVTTTGDGVDIYKVDGR